MNENLEKFVKSILSKDNSAGYVYFLAGVLLNAQLEYQLLYLLISILFLVELIIYNLQRNEKEGLSHELEKLLEKQS